MFLYTSRNEKKHVGTPNHEQYRFGIRLLQCPTINHQTGIFSGQVPYDSNCPQTVRTVIFMQFSSLYMIPRMYWKPGGKPESFQPLLTPAGAGGLEYKEHCFRK